MYITSADFLAYGRTPEEVYLFILVLFVYRLCCPGRGMGRMLRAAQAGSLVGLPREAPEQPDPVLYKQLVSPRTPLLSKNSCSVAPLFPLLSQHSDSPTISTEIPVYFFFLNFASCSLALTDGGRIQASWPK